jgi:hypothetical protein
MSLGGGKEGMPGGKFQHELLLAANPERGHTKTAYTTEELGWRF